MSRVATVFFDGACWGFFIGRPESPSLICSGYAYRATAIAEAFFWALEVEIVDCVYRLAEPLEAA